MIVFSQETGRRLARDLVIRRWRHHQRCPDDLCYIELIVGDPRANMEFQSRHSCELHGIVGIGFFLGCEIWCANKKGQTRALSTYPCHVITYGRVHTNQSTTPRPQLNNQAYCFKRLGLYNHFHGRDIFTPAKRIADRANAHRTI